MPDRKSVGFLARTTAVNETVRMELEMHCNTSCTSSAVNIQQLNTFHIHAVMKLYTFAAVMLCGCDLAAYILN